MDIRGEHVQKNVHSNFERSTVLDGLVKVYFATIKENLILTINFNNLYMMLFGFEIDF